MGARTDKATQQPGGPLVGGRTAMSRWLVASVALHVFILGVLLYTRPPQFAPVALPGDRTGHLLSLTYMPGSSVPAPTLQARKRHADLPAHVRAVTAPVPDPTAPSAPAVASASADAATGTDALGDGDTTLALVVAHPPPHPDLTQLPSGTRGDVIVDVVIDANGRIAKFTMTRGLGHGVDETVLAAIRQWTFQPATRNGVPVASEQELLFHYERG